MTQCAPAATGYQPRHLVKWQQFSKMKNVHLLRVPEGASAETTCQHGSHVYHLQSHPGARCMSELPGKETKVKMCDECMVSLKGGKVPRICLATLDPGMRPAHLEPLTWVESVVVAPFRAMRHIVSCKPKGDSRAAVACSPALVGHVIAVPHPGPGELMNKVFPLPMEKLPDMISVSDVNGRHGACYVLLFHSFEA